MTVCWSISFRTSHAPPNCRRGCSSIIRCGYTGPRKSDQVPGKTLSRHSGHVVNYRAPPAAAENSGADSAGSVVTRAIGLRGLRVCVDYFQENPHTPLKKIQIKLRF